MNIKYDLHIHSCLSPCGDEEMTPNNIVNMSLLAGLDVIALTDHNTAKNCGAAIRVGERNGLLVIPGMELTTAEDIHVVCLFPTLESAQSFENEVWRDTARIPNRPDIFGRQLLMDDKDEEAGEVPYLLLYAVGVQISDIAALARSFGGATFPAHIGKESNGILQTLGGIPPECSFRTVEIDSTGAGEDHPDAAGLKRLYNSDAHYLWQIGQAQGELELSAASAEAIINYINTA
ncbi:MAG: PHP domain-containing protein [Eubacteriales bacterium]